MTFGDTNNKVEYAYDAIGRVSSRTVTAAGHAYATAYGYAAGNNGSGNTTTLISFLTQSGENFTYTYDDVGNIASVVQNNKTTAYTYDALDQLIRVNDENDPTSGTAGTTWTYEYDRGGNILEKKRYAYTTGTLGTALETVTYTYDTTWKDKLINYNGITIEYDAIGNPTKAGTKTGEVWDPDTWHYTWARGRQLQVMYKGSFGQPGYDEIAFTYNHEGLRTRKTRMYYSDGDVAYSSTEYTLHGKNIVHMTQGSNSLHFFYDASNRLAIVEWNNGVTAAKYAYIQNLQGDIVGIVDSIGTEVVKYTYDAWGRVLSTTGSLAATLGTVQPFRYRGYVYDVETGLYYLRARYYNPNWNRFINADGIIQGNLFSYCNNLVVRLHDPDGHDAIWITEEGNVGTMGHTSMLFRDEEDSSWYYFYWGPRHNHLSDSAIIFIEKIDVEIIDGVFINLEKLNEDLAEIHGAHRSYSSAFYFKGGDFGPSIKYAKELKDKYNSSDEKAYNLFARNCMQMSADVMTKSIEDQDLEKFLIWIANQIIPSAVVPLFREITKLPETRIDPLSGTYYVRK